MKRAFTIVSLSSALWLVFGCSESHERMLRQLEMLEQANRADSVMRDDSLAEALAGYFDSHGSANERMRAYYILGRTYFDLGELPRALETYYQAADCADTTAADCDYKTLSRVHAQAANVFYEQIQPRSQMYELTLARHYALQAGDTLMSIECLAEQASGYKLLNNLDSVIIIVKAAERLFRDIGREDRSNQIIGIMISSLIARHDVEEAKCYLDRYECLSGFFDEDGSPHAGFKLTYYNKGLYYLLVNQVDSAEIMFRRLLCEGATLNHMIAGNQGLMKVFKQRHQPDSFAKYAERCCDLNDSAYSLSEMENIQKFQASYNYNHNKILAEQSMAQAEHSRFLLLLVVMIVCLLAIILYRRFSVYRKHEAALLYKHKESLMEMEKIQSDLLSLSSDYVDRANLYEFFKGKMEELSKLQMSVQDYKAGSSKRSRDTLENRLVNAPIVVRLKELLESNPYHNMDSNDMRDLRNLLNEEIPGFYNNLNKPHYTLSLIEFEVCMLLRVHFTPIEIHKLTGLSTGYISNIRKRLLLKVFGEDGSPKEFDRRVLAIE